MENYWMMLVAIATLALTGTLGIAWRVHVRAMKRWLSALDRYAERQLGQEQREKTLTRPQTTSTGLRQLSRSAPRSTVPNNS